MNSLYKNKIRYFLLLAVCSIFLHASAQVNANFSGSPIAGCAPLQVTFSDLSTGSPTSWNWNFGNGNSGTGSTASAIYVLPGKYTVTLSVSGGAGSDVEIKTDYILVYNKPQAEFTMSSDTACIGQSIVFKDASIISPNAPPIGTWDWDFGDGFSSSVNVSSTSHTYATPGTYPVSVIATDVNGCLGSVVHNIVVLPKPTMSFSATPTSACVPPVNVTFTNHSVSAGATTYSWSFGDGTNSSAANPTHTYTATGTYSVTLYVNQNGCIDSLVKPKAIIIQKIQANFAATPTVVCTGSTINFTNTSVPGAATATWDFGDGGSSASLNPAHTYLAAGTYTVNLISSDQSGCKDTTEGIVVVNQTPKANFTADTMVACSTPFTVNFTNTSTGGTNYVWDFGDGSAVSTQQNPTHVYNTQGTFSVSLVAINANGPCVDSIRKNFIFIKAPLAGFIQPPDSGCVPLPIKFISTSISNIDPIANYIWNFGDGSTGISAPPLNHTYTASGVYSPSLIIQTVHGCSDTVACPNCIKAGTNPVANFGILEDTVCYGNPITFSDLSTGATGWLWIFGDGQSMVGQNAIHVYPDTGTYSVKLVAYNNGCADTSLVQKVVILPPKAIFNYVLSCTNYYTVNFASISHGADSLLWKFGDGGIDSSNNINPSHTYTSRGPFTVTLTAYNFKTGCSDSTTLSFTIAQPIASYSTTTTNGCYPFSVILNSTSQDAATYLWDLGDPSSLKDTSTADSATFTYNNTGQYTVTLIITDLNGCKDTLKDTLKALGPYPYFYVDTLTGCRPLLVTFVDTSVSDSVLTQWTWNFGDGTPIMTTTNDSIMHTYTVPGNFAVTMTVKDTNGCIKTIVKNNYVIPTYPYPAFIVDTFACRGDVLTYNASGTTVAVPATYNWNFGDGNTFSAPNPVTTHAYTSDGYYTVSLTVTDVNGCDSTITQKVRILKPTANFRDTILNLGCRNVKDSLIDLSTGYITSWLWNFGDGGTSIAQNPTHTYIQPGYYTITLIVTNAGGCKDTVQQDSVFVPGPIGTFTLSPVSGCNPLNVCFETNSVNSDLFLWDFADGTVDTAVAHTICHKYVHGGVFNPIMIMQNTLPDGKPCQVQAPNQTGPVTVTNVINISLNVPPVITLPLDSVLSVTATYSGGSAPYTFYWSPDSGLNCDTCTTILIIGKGDTIFYTFNIQDAFGCQGVDSILILSPPCFKENLIPNVFSPNADGHNDIFYIPGVCPGDKYSLRIFNRWGTLMFTTSLRNNGWDGRTNSGVDATDGVYYFIVEVDGQVYKGFVQLLR